MNVYEVSHKNLVQYSHKSCSQMKWNTESEKTTIQANLLPQHVTRSSVETTWDMWSALIRMVSVRKSRVRAWCIYTYKWKPFANFTMRVYGMAQTILVRLISFKQKPQPVSKGSLHTRTVWSILDIIFGSKCIIRYRV